MATTIPRDVTGAVACLALAAACAGRAHPATATATAAACNDATEQAIVHVRLPGNPFQALPTADGCWIFVSMIRGEPDSRKGLAVIRRRGGALDVVRIVGTTGAPAGMTMTHDGRTLIVAAQDRVELFDVSRLITGHGSPRLGELDEGRPVGAISATVTANDSLLFVSNEHGESILVVDLAESRRRGARTPVVLGRVPALVPISVVLSPDERLLYATTMTSPPSRGWPLECHGLAANAPASVRVPQGAVLVIDVGRAAAGRADAVLGAVPAGCSPVRLTLSPGADTMYVTVRWDSQLLALDTRRLLADPAHALLARVPVGTAPVGVLAIDGGKLVVVANSNRFAGDASDRQTVSVIDASRLSAGAGAVIGSIPAGAFPREMRLTADGRTLLLTNFGSRTLEVIDVARVRSLR